MTKASRDTLDYGENTADDDEKITSFKATDHGLDIEDVAAVDEVDEPTEDEYVQKEEREFNFNKLDHNNAFELAEGFHVLLTHYS